MNDKSKIWLTIDIEEITDTNFNILWKQNIKLDYDKLINDWINLCDSLNIKSTCFVLGSFAKKYPHLIKKLYDNNHEIASHGNNHKLVYDMSLAQWEDSLIKSKDILEDITNNKITGYRSASWSLPFEKKYYQILAKNGYKYSSSYFPMKTYMYGNSINKKQPFKISTPSGDIMEYPIIKNIIPFSGGFYLRVLPMFILKQLFKRTNNTIIYIHPYEIMSKNLLIYFSKYANINLDFFLAFYSTSKPINKIYNLYL
jgi:hypothetical protein